MKIAIIALGLIAAIGAGIGFLTFGHSHEIAWTAGVVVLCAAWWILEPIPVPATSLIPIVVFPTVGVLSAEQTAGAYGHNLVLLLMVPATISCSFAFMLPVATPPNAIVFGSQRLTTEEMAREGLVLNLLGVIVATTICWLTLG